jgi:hydroxymethylglutaryl-CoA lyase
MGLEQWIAVVFVLAELYRSCSNFNFIGLGGCHFSLGATGDAATEYVVHALQRAGYNTGVDLRGLVETSGLVSD